MMSYEIDNRTVYDTLDQIYKDRDLYPYTKQIQLKQNDRGSFHVIQKRWLGPKHVNAMAFKAKIDCLLYL